MQRVFVWYGVSGRARTFLRPRGRRVHVAGQWFAEFDERSIERRRMQEADAARDADTRLLVDHLDLFALQCGKVVVDAIDLEADVVKTLAALLEIASDAGIGDNRLQQLDLAVTEREERGADTLLRDDLLLAHGKAERIAVEAHRQLGIADDDA